MARTAATDLKEAEKYYAAVYGRWQRGRGSVREVNEAKKILERARAAVEAVAS